MTYASQPLIYPENSQTAARLRLQQIVRRAKYARVHSDAMRVCFIGDSTFTSPGGFGVALHHAATKELGQMLGIAGTPDRPPYVNTNGQPYIGTGNNNVQAVSAGWYASNHAPPNAGAVGLPYRTGEGSHQPSALCDPACGFSTPSYKALAAHLFGGQDLQLELKFLKQSGSAEAVRLVWVPTTAPGVNLFATVLATEDITVSLDEAATGVELVTYTSLARTPTGGAPFAQWFFQSNEETTAGVGSAAPPVLCSCRILNPDPRGVMLDFRGVSGGNANSLLGDTVTGSGGSHNNCMPWLSQLGYDVAVLGFGTNDIFGAGFEAADVARNYYDPDGASNKGIIGEWVEECQNRGLTPPLFILYAPPLRAADSTGYSSLKNGKYQTLAEVFTGLVDELAAAGIDAIVLNGYRHTYEAGFTEQYNDTTGLTDQGTYNEASVAYAVGDYYRSGVDNKLYECIRAHTSSATNAPTGTNAFTFHLPLREHLVDGVHRTTEGAKLEGAAIGYLFAEHDVSDYDSAADNAISRRAHVVKPQWQG